MWEVGNLVYKPDDLDFGGSLTPNALNDVVAAGAESPALSCSGKEYILLHVEYEDGAVVADLGIDLLGHNANPARNPSTTQSPVNKNRQAGVLKAGYFLGAMVIIPVLGAKQFIVVNEILLTKKVCVWATTI